MDVKRTAVRRGMSLLELLLALALSVIILALIGNAIYFHLRTFQSRRDGVEQALVARAVLRQIGDDIRCAVAFRAVDTKALDAVSGGAQQLASSVAGVDLQSITGGNNSLPGSEGSAEAAETEMSEEGSGGYQAGFYGDAYSLQFDMTRLPRLDEYDPVFSLDGTGGVTRIPADIRTISYHLDGGEIVERLPSITQPLPGTSGLAAPTALEPTGARGLVRTEQDRSLAASGGTNLTGEEVSTTDKIASEVVRLEFRYFDGYEWWTEWNSDDRGGLPLAVEIVVGIEITGGENMPLPNTYAATSPVVENPELQYRLVVKIPTAEPLPYEEELPEEGMEGETNAASAASNTPSPTTATGGAS